MPETPNHDELLDKAMELLRADQAKATARDNAQALEEAAAEVGIPTHYVQQARNVLASEQQEIQEAKKQGRRRLKRVAAILVAVPLTLVGLGSIILATAPEWSDGFDSAATWELVAAESSLASFELVRSEDRGSFGRVTLPDEPNKGPAAPPVSLSNPNLPVDLFHYTSLNFRARAEGLQHVTLIFDVLEGGRLRSKPVPLTTRWHTHTVHYEDLTYEKQEADRWVPQDPFLEPSVSRLHFRLDSPQKGKNNAIFEVDDVILVF